MQIPDRDKIWLGDDINCALCQKCIIWPGGYVDLCDCLRQGLVDAAARCLNP